MQVTTNISYIRACITPRDPVLSNSIVKGKFANKNILKDLLFSRC